MDGPGGCELAMSLPGADRQPAGLFAGRMRTTLRPWLRRLGWRGRPGRQAAKPGEWSIGIYAGPSPLALAPLRCAWNPVLTRYDVTDVRAKFVADPFMLPVGDSWYMFFEIYNAGTRKGEIGLATSRNGWRWTYQRVVLAEAFHLSYPFVFEWQGTYYLVPESHQAGEVRVYRARRFPDAWEPAGVLLSGQCFADSTLFRQAGQWWLFTETGPQNRSDTLRLYLADDLAGPWREHPHSPVVAGDASRARPAGRVVTWGNQVLRFAQDCSAEYGTRVHAFQVTALTSERYAEQPVEARPRLGPSNRGWNAGGMHHVDAHLRPGGGWLACVDGRTPFAASAAGPGRSAGGGAHG